MKQCITIIIVLLPLLTISQNMVIDSSFELYNTCPNNDPNSRLSELKYWFSPTLGTPDYYHKCAGKKLFGGVPENGFGIQKPKTGLGYIGLILHNRPEYAQCKLKLPLSKGQKYCITIYVNWPDVYNESTDKISVSLTQSDMATDSAFVYLYPPERNIINLRGKDSFLTDKVNWTKLCSTYEAAGGEEFLTIGTFRNNVFQIYWPQKVFDKTHPDNGVRGVYYFFDDISVVPLENKLCDCTGNKSSSLTPVKGKPIVLKNIFFENDKSELLSKSFAELDTLVRYLQMNPLSNIQIAGYTDNKGDKVHNLMLSKRRAMAVSNYLIQKGINSSRIQYEGYGSAKPIGSNSTESGRQKNRRVEFTIY